MRKLFTVLCALALLMLALAACGSNANRPELLIAGHWVPEGSAQFQAMEFVPNNDNPQSGKVRLSMMGNEISGTYDIVPGNEQHYLTITYTLTLFPTTKKFDFTVESDDLVLQEENAPASTTYRRSVAE